MSRVVQEQEVLGPGTRLDIDNLKVPGLKSPKVLGLENWKSSGKMETLLPTYDVIYTLTNR